MATIVQPEDQKVDWRSVKWAPALVGTALLVASFGCYDNSGLGSAESTPPVALLKGVDSRQSPEQVARWLSDKGLDWAVIEASDLPDGDTRPRFSILEWHVDDFTVGDVSGQTYFSFYNDQLMTLWFYPRDQAGLERIAAEAGLGEKATIVRDGVRLRRNWDFRGEQYIAYEDERLVQEMDAWLTTYS